MIRAASVISIHKKKGRLISILGFMVLILTCNVTFAEDQKKLDRLLVYGDGFIFGVKEPRGWKADISNAANIHANILFYRPGESLQNAEALIFVRINQKSDEDVEKDLEWDMDQYRKKYPKVQFRDILVAHPNYKVYPKLFYIKDTFYEYVTYINPGKGKPVMLSAAMNVQKKEANKEAFEAYKQVIETLVLLKP